MLNFNQFGNTKPQGVKPPKVKYGGAPKLPKIPASKEERDLMEAKANMMNAKAAKMRREG